MADALAASLLDLVLGLAVASPGTDESNRLVLEGITSAPRNDGALDIGIRRMEAASLRTQAGRLTVDIGNLAVHELAASVRNEEGRLRLRAASAARAELSGVKVHGPLFRPSPKAKAAAAPTPWCLAPLAAADGMMRAEIVDAQLLFDAQVAVPIRQGRIAFGEATVEHVGPDSRMGASRLGVYVDAPNGRSYLYQFPSAPVSGVEYERRGALLGPWVTDRGSLQLQAFGEWLARQNWRGQAMGVTEQARGLFDRTSISGDVQLGDGRLAGAGVHADLVGRAEGHNTVRLHSKAVGRGLDLEMPSLSVRDAQLRPSGLQLELDEMAAAVAARIFFEDGQLRCAFELSQMEISGLRLHLQPEEEPR